MKDDEERSGSDFRFKSTAERMLALHRDECRNCTRPAIPDGRLCTDCLTAYRSDRSIGQYPIVAAAWVFGIAALATLALIIAAFNITTDDAPTQAAATSTYTPQPVYSAPKPIAPSYSQPTATGPEAAFIAALDEYEVPYTMSTAISAGRKVCDLIDVGIESGYVYTDILDAAESILVDDGHTAAEAYAIVGAAGRLC